MPNKLRLAVLGAGRWGPNLIRNFFDNRRSSVTWVADVDENRLGQMEKAYPGIKTTCHWESAVNSSDVDAVVIASPTSHHFEMGRAALKAEKHVFVEKPISTSRAEALALAELSRSMKRKLMVGHLFLFHPGIRLVKKLLEEQKLGQVLYAYSTRTNLGPLRTDVNAAWDLAPHDIAILSYLFESYPLSLTASGASFINPPIEDVVFANFKYPGNILASLHVSWLDPNKVRQLVIVGSQKMLVFDDMDLRACVKVYNKKVRRDISENRVVDTLAKFRKTVIEGPCHVPKVPNEEPLREECEAFLDWILLDKTQPSDAAFGTEVVTILESITKSLALNGAAVQVPSGDAETTSELGASNSKLRLVR